MKVLVIGGNHFFGKKLVALLIEKGHDITLLNRGNRDDGFGDRVKRIKCDRQNTQELSKCITNKYDLVFDQCCFDYDQAKLACEVFKDKVGRYIFTSSISAYNEYGANLKEDHFDINNWSFETKETMDSNYGEAKRQAEAAFFKYSTFPVIAVRFPIVLDSEDATKRLQFHVNRIKNEEEIFFNNLNAKMSFISADDAARGLYELSETDFSGPINVASPQPIILKNFIQEIELHTGKKMIEAKSKNEENNSPYGIEKDWYIDTSLLNSLGIELNKIESYLSVMIKKLLS